ncbi:MAG: Nif3-like dinuclear metal center hexameric protein, partial [Candidatus Micrarchaeota archaeon]|nr:Nif3-like dinuclear metal center hexameric protein [Candidatus Micrarchaeota archaeon]
PDAAFEALAKTVQARFGPARVFALGPTKIRNVAVCSGSGGFCATFAPELGFDALVTGEFNHANYHDALEHGCNVIELGHYATETLGVAATADWLAQKFGVKAVFLDHPTGL